MRIEALECGEDVSDLEREKTGGSSSERVLCLAARAPGRQATCSQQPPFGLKNRPSAAVGRDGSEVSPAESTSEPCQQDAQKGHRQTQARPGPAA